LIVEDHPVYRVAVRSALESHPELYPIAAVSDGDEALRAIDELAPDVALLDIRLPTIDGIAVIRTLRAAQSPTKVIVLSASDDAETVYDAVEAGAAGFLTKAATADEICNAVLAAARGHSPIARDLQGLLAREIRARAEPVAGTLLTPREHEVLSLSASGESVQEIAGELFVSAATVKSHLRSIYEKLGVSSRTAAVAQAIRGSLI
jgi:two-component system nitrate/nitrite response regulator NarL